MPRYLGLALLALIVAAAAPAAAQPGEQPLPIVLSRRAFDPLREPPARLAGVEAASTLALVQLNAPPDAAALQALRAAGMEPLLYIPEQTLLVRSAAGPVRAAALPEVRWTGALDPAFKVSAELDAALSAPSGALELRVIATPDADLARIAGALDELGAELIAQAPLVSGAQLHLRLPAASLAALVARDDVLWAEPYATPELMTDEARAIIGLEAPAVPEWLNGAGQTIAVTDSGLDVQSSLSPDFAGRVVRGFANRDMVNPSQYRACSSADWSDRHGHGTHVFGIAAGGGVTSQGRFAGAAPQAGLVIQNTSTGGNSLNCFPSDTSYLLLAYNAGARIQNGSFGSPTGSGGSGPQYGAYTAQDQLVDDFLWDHPEHLFVVAVGNSGADRNLDGKVDSDSINTPATAKNILAVGASENNRPPTDACGLDQPENLCYGNFAGFQSGAAVLANDPISDDADGLAAFSSRGPTDDGRLKPDLVAPGTSVIATRSHYPTASYGFTFGGDHAYDQGTSMSAPFVSGAAALARQWLAGVRRLSAPSAALVRAMLLNGAVDIQPGQYGTGPTREIGPGWPNPDEGWGRLSVEGALPLEDDRRLWFAESSGLVTAQVAEYPLTIAAGQPLRVTLAWTDYPGSPLVGRALVDNLDLELELPDGTVLRGNADAVLAGACRSAAGADVCNTAESIELASPAAGAYRVRVRGTFVSPLALRQPFAVTARAARIESGALAAPVLQAPVTGASAAVRLAWNAIGGAERYQVESASTADFSSLAAPMWASGPALTAIQEPGTHYYRVRACTSGGCGPASNVQAATTSVIPRRSFLPNVVRPLP